ncbi:MAG: hypothetical protein JW910_18910 [Anaerolineae bacterium]|nr:hypothetical protein [Anaerolineae bacterium]
MSSSTLMRWCGLANVSGGVIVVIVRLLEFALYGEQPKSIQALDPAFLPALGLPGLVASVLLLIGLVGLYARQAAAAGRAGLIAFSVAFFGVTLSVGGNWVYAFGSPVLAEYAPAILDGADSILNTGLLISYFLGLLGWVLIAAVTWWVNVLPRWAAGVFFASALFLMLSFALPGSDTMLARLLANVLIAAGPFALGVALWRHPGPSPAEGV